MFCSSMDYQHRGGGGACNHIMAASDPHLRCPGCWDCFLSGNPCSVWDSLSAEQLSQAIQTRYLRLRRQARRAGSTDSLSHCGPKEAGHLGTTPDPSVSGQLRKEFTSLRSKRSPDDGRGSPSAESLSSLAGEDGDSRRNTSLGPRSQDGGSGWCLGSGPLPPRGEDQVLRRQAFCSFPPRGEDQVLRRQAFRQRSRTPVRKRDRSRSASSDSSEPERSDAVPGRSTGWSRRTTGPDRPAYSPRFKFGDGTNLAGYCRSKECHGCRGISGGGIGAAGGCYALCSSPTSPTVGGGGYFSVSAAGRLHVIGGGGPRVAVIGAHNTQTVSPNGCHATGSRQ